MRSTAGKSSTSAQRSPPGVPVGGVGLLARVFDGLRRRTRAAWTWLSGGPRRPPVEAAFDWLLARDAGQGLPAEANATEGCPLTTALAIRMAHGFGLRDLVQRWSAWLIAAQRPDGSFSPVSWNAPSLAHTAQAARTLMLVEPDVPEATAAALSACGYLHRRMAGGSVDWQALAPSASVARGETQTTGLLCLLPLWRAARRWERADWQRAVVRTLSACRDPQQLAAGGMSLESFAWRVEALLELNLHTEATRALRRMAGLQQRSGWIADYPGAAGVATDGLAHLAALWYAAGQREAADRALHWLVRRQARDGGFPARLPGRAGPAWTLAAVQYLDAARLQVQTAFDASADEFPSQISPDDGRMRAVAHWAAGLPADARLADVGCGKGRFLRRLSEQFPRARLHGIDASPVMLSSLPRGVAALCGSMLRLPAADGAFDGAFAVESLEHALLPQRAVDELCRIVRPGGEVLVIDKHRARQALSYHDPWERWFTPDELQQWLSRHCDEVHVESVPHSEGRAGRDLFLAARGKRKPTPAPGA